MVKFTALFPSSPDGTSGHRLIGLGISAENVRRLKLGHPMIIKLSDMLPPGTNLDTADIMIMYGETEQELAETLKPYVNEDTLVHGMPRED